MSIYTRVYPKKRSAVTDVYKNNSEICPPSYSFTIGSMNNSDPFYAYVFVLGVNVFSVSFH